MECKNKESKGKKEKIEQYYRKKTFAVCKNKEMKNRKKMNVGVKSQKKRMLFFMLLNYIKAKINCLMF